MPYFDYWVHTDSKGFFKHILVSKDSKEDIWKKPWCDELMEKIETNGDIEEVINAKNQKLYEALAADEITPLEDIKTKYQEELSRLEEKSSRAKIFNQKLDDFEKMLKYWFQNIRRNVNYMLKICWESILGRVNLLIKVMIGIFAN